MSGRMGRGSSSGRSSRHKKSDYGLVMGPVAEDWLDEDEDETMNDTSRLSRVMNGNNPGSGSAAMMFQDDYNYDDYDEPNHRATSPHVPAAAATSFASSWKGLASSFSPQQNNVVHPDRHTRKQRAIKNVKHFHDKMFNAVETDDQDVQYEDGEDHHDADDDDDDDESEYGVHSSTPVRSSWALTGILLMEQLRARKIFVLAGLLMMLLVLASVLSSTSVKHESSTHPPTKPNGNDNTSSNTSSNSNSGAGSGSGSSPVATNHENSHEGRDSHGHSFAGYHDPADLHSSSFGGIQNEHQPAGAKIQAQAQAEGQSKPKNDLLIGDKKIVPATNTKVPTDEKIRPATNTKVPTVDIFLSDTQPPLGGAALTTSAYKWAVPSLTEYNMKNLWGHYNHDEWRSPFASHLYDRPMKELEQEQEEYEAKMEAVRKDWGVWDFTDPKTSDVPRPSVPFDTIEYRDAPRDSFPPNSWQSDEEYLNAFIPQAKALVDRMKEGIYAEYGRPTQFKDGGKLDKQEREERDFDFGVITEGFHVEGSDAVGLETGKKLKGVGFMTQVAWDTLVRKLLHAMMTNDTFYVVMSGNSAAEGAGNNFFQSYMMQFQHIMEPVFDKLGMKLITRNNANGGVGSTIPALGGSSFYGESDILINDAEWFDNDAGPHDLFNRQAILSGERVPIILTRHAEHILAWSNDMAPIGGFQGGYDFVPETTGEKQSMELPNAARYMRCNADGNKLGLCGLDKFNSTCWVDRRDVQPPVAQGAFIKGRTKSHPGWRHHRLWSRKLAMMVLHGLDTALEMWKVGVKANGFPLHESYWHIGGHYKLIRADLIELDAQADEKSASGLATPCELFFPKFPIVCRVPMHGYGEWSPRVTPDDNSIHAIVKHAVNGYYPGQTEMPLYTGPDILPLHWKIPQGDIDVHAIAIASTSPRPLLDHTWNPDDYIDDKYDDKYDDDYDDDTTDDDTTDDDTTDDDLLDNRRRMGGLRAKQNFIQEQLLAENRESVLVEEDNRIRGMRKQLGLTGGTFQPLGSPGDRPMVPMKGSNHEDANRLLKEEGLFPGQGWYLYNAQSGFCDGSSNSECSRKKSESCLMSGQNDHRGAIIGDALSGWLIMELKNIRSGVVLARIEEFVAADADPKTEGWTAVNNDNRHRTQRELFLPVDDFFLDIAINGKIRTLNYTELLEARHSVLYNMDIWPLLLDDTNWNAQPDVNYEGETYEVGMRIRSSQGRDATISITHLYCS